MTTKWLSCQVISLQGPQHAANQQKKISDQHYSFRLTPCYLHWHHRLAIAMPTLGTTLNNL